MTSAYIETSALLRMIFRESGFEKIVEKLKKTDVLVTSRLTHVETGRALHRLHLIHKIPHSRIVMYRYELQEILSRADICEISAGICKQAENVEPNLPIRTLDAIHLGTYFSLKSIDPSLAMISCDDRILNCLGEKTVV